MKAITLIVALALVALASASHLTDNYSSTYAWWYNFQHATVAIGTYLTCLYSAAPQAFFANDGGSGFYTCLYKNGITLGYWDVMVEGDTYITA
jgi:hypothetical protein